MTAGHWSTRRARPTVPGGGDPVAAGAILQLVIDRFTDNEGLAS